MLDGPAQRLAHVALRERRRSTEQRVGHVASGGRGQAQEALRRGVELVDALQQQVAQAARELAGPSSAAARSSSAKNGLPSERAAIVSVRAAGTGASARAASSAARVVVRERPELEQRRRARAPDAVGESAHPLGRGGVVGAIGREQENSPVVEVVGEEDDQVERRRVRPVQILQHQQHRCGGRALGEQRERLLEDPQLRARGRPVDLPKVCERTERLDERLERQLRADEIDGTPEQDLKARATGARRELGREPGLADARVPRDEAVAPLPARAARARARVPRARRHVRRRPRWREPPCGQYRATTKDPPPEDTTADRR